MITFVHRPSGLYDVKWKKVQLGIVDDRFGSVKYYPKGSERKIVWEFATLAELKQHLESDSTIA